MNLLAVFMSPSDQKMREELINLRVSEEDQDWIQTVYSCSSEELKDLLIACKNLEQPSESGI